MLCVDFSTEKILESYRTSHWVNIELQKKNPFHLKFFGNDQKIDDGSTLISTNLFKQPD